MLEGARRRDAFRSDLATETLDKWVFAANVIYADGLFKSEFRVWSNGVVEMIDDEVLFGQMPIIEDKELRQYRARLTPKQEQDTQQ